MQSIQKQKIFNICIELLKEDCQGILYEQETKRNVKFNYISPLLHTNIDLVLLSEFIIKKFSCSYLF